MANTERVLEGVERIHWCSTGSLCFPGAFGAAMRYLGEDVSWDHAMAVTGGSFKTFWMPPWADSNCDLLLLGAEPVRRAFRALGYGCEMVQDINRRSPEHTRAFYQERIVASIDAGKPAIAQGIVGPPEASVIAGYAEGGDVLLGVSYFQEEPQGYFRAERWWENIHSLIEIGEKGERPDLATTVRETLEYAVWLTRTPSFLGLTDGTQPTAFHHNGLAAWDAMAAALLDAGQWQDVPPAEMETRAVALANDGVCLRLSQREAAARWLREMAEAGRKGAAEMRAAADAYDAEVQALQPASQRTPYNFQPELWPRLMDADNRAAIAEAVLEARRIEETAAGHLEAALAAM